MEWIQELNLTSKEQEQIKKLIDHSDIIDIKFIQNNIYLFLKNSKIIRLKNSTELIYKKLKKLIEEESHLNKSELKNLNRRADEWTEEEIESLRYNFYQTPLELLANELNKSQYQISLKVAQLGIVNSGKWDENDIKYLKENLNVSNYELAKTLNRSVSSIKAKKRVFKLEKEEKENMF